MSFLIGNRKLYVKNMPRESRELRATGFEPLAAQKARSSKLITKKAPCGAFSFVVAEAILMPPVVFRVRNQKRLT
jgi:hypothetical protein